MFTLPPELSDDTFARPAPIRVVSPGERHRARYASLDPVATAAALPQQLRRILLLACDRWYGWGYPVWGLAGVTDWPADDVIAIGERLSSLFLVEVREVDGILWITSTPAGHAAAFFFRSWRS